MLRLFGRFGTRRWRPGGQLVAEGTPEEVASNPASYTGFYLREVLKIERKEFCQV